jgi:glycosyltransferase involved in cell wall biosynthesis
MMRILLVNTYHYIRGGDSSYTFNLADLLRKRGHNVICFSMKHPLNVPCEYEKYFVEYIDFREMNEKKNFLNAIKVLSRVIYYQGARERIKKIIKDTKPDIAHLQTIHGHITPSILDELKSENIPVVWTLHDYKLICPNTNLFSKGMICEACKGKHYLQCTLKKCKKNSRTASMLASIEAVTHRYLNISKNVSYFLSPSLFLINKFCEFGWQKDRFIHVPYCLPSANTENSEVGADYALFLGRLESYKGIATLLRAASINKDIKLKIVGGGSEKNSIMKYASENQLNNVEFTGYLQGNELQKIIHDCSFIVVPSEWYENYPYVIMEGMTAGRPVIASRIGGLPEMVDDGVTGFLFEPQNYVELADKMKILKRDKLLREKMGHAGREKAVVDFDPNRHYEKIMQVYSNALNQ